MALAMRRSNNNQIHVNKGSYGRQLLQKDESIYRTKQLRTSLSPIIYGPDSVTILVAAVRAGKYGVVHLGHKARAIDLQ